MLTWCIPLKARRSVLLPFFGLCLANYILALGGTDTITWGGDNTRAGYQANHNMDPNVVGSSDFGQIFKTLLPGNFNNMGPEQIFSQPLVYTGSDGIQYIYVATTQNNVYKLDAKTGSVVASRNLHVPFLQAELESCVDINPLIGVTATGVIDPDTGIWYVTAKTYAQQFQDGNFSPTNPPGRLNGRYWQHAIHTEDLSEATNWPVLVDGTVFRNNPNRVFLGGNQHSRPAALMVGDFIYTGYASHCVQYNYTGAIIGFNKKTGAIVEAFAMEGGPEPNTVKGGGVWMSGGGLAYDGVGSMYFATGNGYASQLKASGNSVLGRFPPTSLEEAAVNAKINSDGTITIVDFFMPWEKTQLDGADKDLGTSPLEILPSDVFTCPNNRRIGVVTGKSGKTYWLDLDNLGGYQNGPNKLDAVIQVFQNENSVYAGAGVMPLEGGYVYISPTQYPTHVFRFECNAAGNAVFTKLADTPEKNAYILGTGHGTTTSLNGEAGTGLLWVSDVQGLNLRIYDPIPPLSGGPLTLLNSFNIPGVTKFTRPVFGDGRVYIGTVLGYLYGFGSPVNAPLNCSSPYNFGNVSINTVSGPLNISCVANTATTVTNIALTSNNFNISRVPALPLVLAVGQSFSLVATCVPSTVGPLSVDVIMTTESQASGFSANTPATLMASGHSAKPVLAIAPNTISFDVIAGQPSSTQTSLFWNLGDSLLTFTNISFSLVSESGPWIVPNVTSDGYLQIGQFVFVYVPTSIGPGVSAPISVIYEPSTAGNDAVYVKGFSDGGSAILDVFGVAGTYPKAVIEFQTIDGTGWVPYSNSTPFTFGTVYEAQNRYLKMRITNGGGPQAVPLSVTVSKPPYGIPGIIGAVNNVDLAEGTILSAGQTATAMLFCAVPSSQVNLPSYNGSAEWVLNTGDPDLGKQEIQFFCNAAAEQVGPLLPNGTASWGYVGCFKENNPGRQLATNIYSDASNNTNGRCINACAAQGWEFAGTQYSQECWCGNAIPIQKDSDANCNFGCTGNDNQTCGGDGQLHTAAHISLFADSAKFNGNTTSPPLQITPNVGNYNFLGCYAETGGKTLSQKFTSSNVMTVEACAAYCTPAYPVFGLEYAAECYCGTKLNTASTLANSTECNMPCKGSNSEYCGAGSRMQIYQLNENFLNSTATISILSSVVTGLSTLSSGSGSSVLSTSSLSATNSSSSVPTTSYSGISPGSSSLTPFTSLAQSSSLLSAHSSSSIAVTLTSASATPNSVALSKASSLSSSTSIPSTAATLSPNSTSLTAAPPPASVYLNCYNEIAGRALVANSAVSSAMTLEFCQSFCFGYTYYAVEYSSECYCGNTIASTSAPIFDGRCSMPCAGNSSEICGGANGLSIYQVTVPPAIGPYVSVGCYAEKSGARSLATVQTYSGMTLEFCEFLAAAAGVTYFGVEYGVECWMGNSLDSATASSQSACSFACPGNTVEFCGAGNYLQLYARSSVVLARPISSTLSSSLASVSTSIVLSSSNSVVSTSTAPSPTLLLSSKLISMTSPLVSNLSISSTVLTPSSLPITSYSISSSPIASPTSVSCPASNYTLYTSPSGATYRVECFQDRVDNDLASGTASSFNGCLALCEATPGCVDVAWISTTIGLARPCYLKSGTGLPFPDSRIWGAVMVSPLGSSGNSSGALLTNLLSSASLVTSANSSIAMAVSTPVVTSSVIFGSSTLFSTSLMSSSTVLTSPPLTMFSTTASSSAPSPTASTSPATMVLISLTSGYPATPSNVALSCPASNGTVYTSYGGSMYLIECYVDHPGGDIAPTATYVNNWEACIAACNTLPSCVDVTFVKASGGACYLKNVTGVAVSGGQLNYGARLISRVANATSSIGVPSTLLAIASSSVMIPSNTIAISSGPSTILLAAPTSQEASSFSSILPSILNPAGSTLSSASLYSSGSIPLSSSTITVESIGSSVSAISIPSLPTSYTTVTAPSPSSSIATTTSSFFSAHTTTLAATGALTNTSSIPLPSIGSYTYQGCWTEPPSGGRALSGLPTLVNAASMTPALCAAYCSQFAVFGLEFSRECFCGPHTAANSTQDVDSACKMPCSGDGSSICGGGNRLSLYKSSDPAKVSTNPVVPSTVGNFTYAGCYVDTAQPRLLAFELASDGMSIEACIIAAELKQYQYAGLEYGRECWIGDALQNTTINVPATSEGECNFSCVGARGELCGGSARMNLYARSGNTTSTLKITPTTREVSSTRSEADAANMVICMPTDGASAVSSPWVCGSG